MRRLRSRAPGRLRLFCFPCAGGGASMFSTWPGELPPEVEVCAVQLPGREDRRGEPPLRRLPLAVQEICASLEPFRERPFALYGHSLGALVAFETARALRRSGGPAPLQLFCSACSAPDQGRAWEPVHLFADPDFVGRVRRLGGIPDAVLNEPEMMALFVPILKADFELRYTYEYREEPPFGFPITAYGGSRDTAVPPEALSAWRNHTAAGFEQLEFPSGHFFIQSHRSLFLSTFSAALRPLLVEAAS